ncbi:thioesterase family protein [soil metagenome]
MTTTATMTAVELDPGWAVGGKPHGGYLLRTAVEQALDETHPHPMAVSAHYLSSPDAGPAQVEVERLRTGRRVASSRVRLLQSGDARVEVLLSHSTLAAGEDHWSAPGGPPELPPLADCPRTPSEGPTGRVVGYFDHVDLRLDMATAQWALGKPQGQAHVQGWMRRDDGADASPLDLLVFADAMPPVTFDLGLMGWVPTLELTVLLRGLPAPGWLRVVQRARLLRDGWLDEECEIWDSQDRLVAQARQLAGYRLEP